MIPLNMKRMIKKNQQLDKILGMQLWLERKPAYTGSPRTQFENHCSGQQFLFEKQRLIPAVPYLSSSNLISVQLPALKICQGESIEIDAGCSWLAGRFLTSFSTVKMYTGLLYIVEA